MYVVLVVWKRLRSSQLCVTVLLNLPLQFSLGKVGMVPYHHLQKQWWYHTTICEHGDCLASGAFTNAMNTCHLLPCCGSYFVEVFVGWYGGTISLPYHIVDRLHSSLSSLTVSSFSVGQNLA